MINMLALITLYQLYEWRYQRPWNTKQMKYCPAFHKNLWRHVPSIVCKYVVAARSHILQPNLDKEVKHSC